MTCIGMGSSTVVDVLIAVSMCWCLYHKKTGFARTDSIIMTLMVYIFSSGVLTSIFACATLISFIISPTTLIAQASYAPLGACYMNSFLALLNNRNLIQEGSNVDSNRSSHLPRTGPTISVTVHRSATMAMDFAGSKHDSEIEPSTLELKRLDGTSTHAVHEGFSKSAV
ncbi:hypothetical protein BJV74DRAFT_244498 [Russula compacta]|nr:hypothetical protein BJV74DRAFT_244498 [Russula compacta]